MVEFPDVWKETIFPLANALRLLPQGETFVVHEVEDPTVQQIVNEIDWLVQQQPQESDFIVIYLFAHSAIFSPGK